jgi:hypothetical protein
MTAGEFGVEEPQEETLEQSGRQWLHGRSQNELPVLSLFVRSPHLAVPISCSLICKESPREEYNKRPERASNLSTRPEKPGKDYRSTTSTCNAQVDEKIHPRVIIKSGGNG